MAVKLPQHSSTPTVETRNKLYTFLFLILQGVPGPRGQKGERGPSGPQVGLFLVLQICNNFVLKICNNRN